MKKAFVSLILGALLLGSAPDARSQSRATLRARFAAVKRELPRCQVVKRTVLGYALEGSEITVYRKRGQPLKMVARHHGEGGRATEEFYFWQGRLFFVLRTDWDYEYPIGQSGSTGREKRSQQRLYFTNGRLTRWLDAANRPYSIPSAEATKAESEYLESARDFLAKVPAPRREIP